MKSIKALTLESNQWGFFARCVETACRTLAAREPNLGDLVLSVRDMPYGRPSNAADPEAILHEWRGTCSNKHLLLVHLLQRLGHPAQLCMAKFSVVPATSGLPQDVLDQITDSGQAFWDVHNYVRADLDGPVVLDITWPAYLRHLYFKVQPRWDERSDMSLAASVSDERRISPDETGLAAKRAWLDALNIVPARREQRERFIEALSHYVMRANPFADREQSIYGTISSRGPSDLR